MSNNEYNIENEFNLITVVDDEQRNYIKKRIIAQILWYDQKSIAYHKLYKRLSTVTIILTAVIPIITIFSDNFLAKVLIALISASASVISYIISINTYKELWLQYRAMCELHKSELHKFINKIEKYNISDSLERFKMFCANCEGSFVREYELWKTYQNKDHSSINS